MVVDGIVNGMGIIEGEYKDGCFGELVVAEMNTISLIVMNMV